MDICTLFDGRGEGEASLLHHGRYTLSVNRALLRRKMTIFGEEAVNRI